MENSSLLTGNYDIDIIILLQLQYEKIMSICKTNKYGYELCKNEYLWHQLIIRDYGVNLSNYTNSFKFAYNILYKSINLGIIAIKYGYIPLINNLIANGVLNSNTIVELVAEHGDHNTLIYYLNIYGLGSNTMDELLVNALINTHIDTIEYLLQNGSNVNTNNGILLEHAIEYKDIILTELLFKYNTIVTKNMFYSMLYDKNYEMFKLILDYVISKEILYKVLTSVDVLNMLTYATNNNFNKFVEILNNIYNEYF